MHKAKHRLILPLGLRVLVQVLKDEDPRVLLGNWITEAEAKVAELSERAIQQEIAAPGSLDCPLIVVEASLAHANILEALGRKMEALATLKAVRDWERARRNLPLKPSAS